MSEILSAAELARFNRHIILPQVGLAGQEKLKLAKVLCIGTGGLGSPISLYLSAAGVGTIGLVDFDVVDDTNLQRQIVHSTADIGRPKVESARDTLIGINPHLKVNLHGDGIKRDNVREMISGYDLVVDGTDNFPTRYLVNDACMLEDKPLIYASIFQFEGVPCPLPINHVTEPLHMGQTKARCADNGCSIGKRRNAGMTRVQGFPSGELPGGYLLRCAFLQWNNHCFKSTPCI